jgi:hypothetical protein
MDVYFFATIIPTSSLRALGSGFEERANPGNSRRERPPERTIEREAFVKYD